MTDSINKNFNHFKIHTQYSICEGAIKIDQLKETVAEKILGQEKPISVIDSNNKVVGVVKPSKVIHTVFGGRKENL